MGSEESKQLREIANRIFQQETGVLIARASDTVKFHQNGIATIQRNGKLQSAFTIKPKIKEFIEKRISPHDSAFLSEIFSLADRNFLILN